MSNDFPDSTDDRLANKEFNWSPAAELAWREASLKIAVGAYGHSIDADGIVRAAAVFYNYLRSGVVPEISQHTNREV